MSVRIEDINGLAFNYYKDVLPQFNEICDPLFKFGIPYFGYLKIFKNGSYLSLRSNPSYNKEYLASIKDQGFFGTNKINSLKENEFRYVLFGDDINSYDIKIDPIMHLLYDFNIWNIMAIHKMRQNDFVECYSFGLTRSETNAPQFYLDNHSLLEHFTTYFNGKAQDIINCDDKGKLAVFEQQFTFGNMSQDDLLAQKIEQFLQKTKINHYSLKTNNRDVQLTKREIECLQYLSAYKAIKEIGNMMGISSRTVEFHLSNIKKKTDLHHRSALVNLYMENTASF